MAELLEEVTALHSVIAAALGVLGPSGLWMGGGGGGGPGGALLEGPLVLGRHRYLHLTTWAAGSVSSRQARAIDIDSVK